MIREHIVPEYLRNLYVQAQTLEVDYSDDNIFNILVTGARTYDNFLIPTAVLMGLTVGRAAVRITHGAAKGLDSIARDIAVVNASRGWSEEGFPANWKMFPRSAGPRRNQKMLEVRIHDVCVGFPLPGSKGTWDMLTRAYRASVPSYVVSAERIRPMTEADCVKLYPLKD